MNCGITFKRNSQDNELQAYCDSDFAGDVHTRKSTTGFVVFYCGGPISWCSRKQDIVTQSSTEAEYVAAAECCKQLLYLKSLIEEVTCKTIKINLNIDNQSSIKLIKNGIINRRSKHIDVKYHFIHDLYEDKIINIKYCQTEKQIADILTKALGNVNFKKCKDLLVS